MLSRLRILFYVLPLLLLASCSGGAIYDEYNEVPESGWYKNDNARLDCNIDDTLSNYKFILSLRHSINYKFSNLFLFMSTTYPNGNIGRDTIELVLADKTGKWHGNGWGDIRDVSVPLIGNMRFPLKGNYTFELQQAMRTDTLKGIENIGIRIEKTE